MVRVHAQERQSQPLLPIDPGVLSGISFYSSQHLGGPRVTPTVHHASPEVKSTRRQRSKVPTRGSFKSVIPKLVVNTICNERWT